MNKTLMGIRAPQTAEECLECSSVEGMRRAIFRASRECSMINEVLYRADMRGLSGEDRYVALAYNALVALESMSQALHEYLLRHPTPPLVIPISKGRV